MNRSYTLNSVCPKFISNKQVFRKIGVRIFEVLLYTKFVRATNTRPFGEVFSTALSLTHFAKIEDKNVIAKE